MCDYSSESCTCQAPPPVSVETKQKLCGSVQPLVQQYCKPTQNPKECENMARIYCLESHDAGELFHFMQKVSNTTGQCRPPCILNYWGSG